MELVPFNGMMPGEYEGRRPWGKNLRPPPHPPQELGFYEAPPSAAYLLHEKDLKIDKLEPGAMPSAIDNGIVNNSHPNRKWDRCVAYETMTTGSYRPAPGVKGPLGGKMEYTNINVPYNQMEDSVIEAQAELRVAARKWNAKRDPGYMNFRRERITEELNNKINGVRSPKKSSRSNAGSSGSPTGVMEMVNLDDLEADIAADGGGSADEEGSCVDGEMAA